MALNRKEYWQTMRLTRAQVTDLRQFQEGFKEYGVDGISSELEDFLNDAASVLSLVSLLPNATPAGVLSAIVGLFAMLLPVEKQATMEVLENGLDALENLESQLNSHPTWQGVEINAPMLEFVDKKVKCVQGNVTITGWMVNGSWN